VKTGLGGAEDRKPTLLAEKGQREIPVVSAERGLRPFFHFKKNARAPSSFAWEEGRKSPNRRDHIVGEVGSPRKTLKRNRIELSGRNRGKKCHYAPRSLHTTRRVCTRAEGKKGGAMRPQTVRTVETASKGKGKQHRTRGFFSEGRNNMAQAKKSIVRGERGKKGHGKEQKSGHGLAQGRGPR